MNDGPDSRTLVLVGDRFAPFAAHGGVTTVGAFLAAVRAGRYDGPGGPVVVRVGQGVDERDLALVHSAAGRSASGRVQVEPHPGGVLPQVREVHKRVSQNVLVADVRQVAEHVFRAALRLHNDNELLLDHQGSRHVQGMVAVEAARQLFLTVSERYYAVHRPELRYSYLLTQLSTRFESPLFPVDATVEAVVLRADLADPQRLSFGHRIEVLQAGRVTSSTLLEAVALPEGRSDAREDRLTDRVLAGAFGAEREPVR
ncbi:A-factor biosynthesis protein AfsA [Kitasatospora phosalacinea]|uniref:A-factor biosynthesis protein AfsA n=1 Tax=Kitasatospora phosalacinea TaxID=2065 RepID=A0A9W6Q571_9ACTN|nr:AfsA-related hotdog domain-containing protein [Kitasatospora phosalacinea]GLW68382.1 A-factor biosynthesis protein AfsA [Kitasatospora phosalacinea]